MNRRCVNTEEQPKFKAPRSVKTKETKDKIYKAAEHILSEHGYEYLSVKNICQEAGIANGTFCYHFKSKDELLSYYMFERFNCYLEESGIDFASMPFDERLIKRYVNYVDYVKSSGIDFVSNFYSPKNASLNTRLSRTTLSIMLVDQVVGIFQEGIDKGFLSPERSALEYTGDSCTILKGIVFDWAVSDGMVETTELIERLIGAYLDSIRIK